MSRLPHYERAVARLAAARVALAQASNAREWENARVEVERAAAVVRAEVLMEQRRHAFAAGVDLDYPTG